MNRTVAIFCLLCVRKYDHFQRSKKEIIQIRNRNKNFVIIIYPTVEELEKVRIKISQNGTMRINGEKS